MILTTQNRKTETAADRKPYNNRIRMRFHNSGGIQNMPNGLFRSSGTSLPVIGKGSFASRNGLFRIAKEAHPHAGKNPINAQNTATR
ncbi:hypothetical protein [Leyella lascolaii]|uniref:hypothetical protein n=1 Tax=Leyella lascolaii TaxID=1776379 RepID=UPI00083A1141|nr:hypothetical protein [Leyella lascolaii]